jgi:hypothetical protein
MLAAVFQIDGVSIQSMDVATAVSDPLFYQQVKAIFPRQLWSTTHSQQVPKVDVLVSTALHNAGC